MKTGHYPTDPAVAYDNDKICEDWNDHINNFGGCAFIQEKEPREAAAASAFEKCEAFIKSVAPFLEKKTTGFLFGDKLMTADFMVGNIYVSHCMLPDNYGQDTIDKFLAKYPWFAAYGKRFAAENKAYLDKRPKCPF